MKVAIYVPHANSLKEKRKVVRSVKDRVKARFNVSIAEVGALDLWQRAEFGVAVAAADAAHADSQLSAVLNLITSTADVIEVSTELECR
ncbi:MAG: DUF503 domain-containing protein [Nitrospinae bacterium]|nr:DUF503 domain-containing protein [Nitrospinota bacterium]